MFTKSRRKYVCNSGIVTLVMANGSRIRRNQVLHAAVPALGGRCGGEHP